MSIQAFSAIFGLLATTALAQVPSSAPPANAAARIVASGCVAKNGDIEVDKGTRQLDARDSGFALTNVRVLDAVGTAGTSPSVSSTDTGTLPAQPSVPIGTGNNASTSTPGFSLAGKGAAALEPYIGQRIEVTGTLDPNELTAPDHEAHPSATLRKLTVISFKTVSATCDK